MTRTVTKFRIGSRALVALLSEFGSGAAGKRVPGWVYRLPREDQAALWEGWRDSDGYISANGAQKVTTVSVQLAHGMARVARNAFRRAVSVHHVTMPATCVIEGRTVNQRDQYQVVLPPSNREAFIENGWCWAPVRSTTASAPDHVYNFGVKDDESYTVWGIAVHNCQDLSIAGRRTGMYEGTRSNLWENMREGITTLLPDVVVWENVRGAASARADSYLGWTEGLLDARADNQKSKKEDWALRALGRVLGDLSSLRYDAEWISVRASHLGASHSRSRLFVLAWRRDGGYRLIEEAASRVRVKEAIPTTGKLLPTITTRDGKNVSYQPNRRSQPLASLVLDSTSFGEYTEAISHHERLVGRKAPSPTMIGLRGETRLSPAFAEWFMGLPNGYITNSDLTGNQQIKMLGNGVFPQQALAAIQTMLLRATR